jgi:hypothetical protein
LFRIAFALTLALLCYVAAFVFYRASTAPKTWQRPRLIVCPLREPSENADEFQFACRRSLALPASGPDRTQDRAIWVEQSAAELACVLDCVAQSKKDRAKSQY